MRKIIIYIFGLLVVASCGRKHVDQKELCGNTARQNYVYLLEGNYDAFVDGTYRQDSIRAEYKAQLIENAKMFVAQQQKEHQGIKEVKVDSVELDSVNHTASVILNLTYGDKTNENVLLPMVEKNDIWYMR